MTIWHHKFQLNLKCSPTFLFIFVKHYLIRNIRDTCLVKINARCRLTETNESDLDPFLLCFPHAARTVDDWWKCFK